MKKLLFFLAALPSLAFSAGNFDNGHWIFDQSYLNTKSHDPIEFGGISYTHSISYTMPNGMNSKSDMCFVTSDTSLSCMTNDSVTLDPANYTATLRTQFSGAQTYYVEGHLPTFSPLSGSWKRQNSPEGNYCTHPGFIKLDIPSTAPGTKVFTNVFEAYEGNQHPGSKFYLLKDKSTGHVILSDYDDGYVIAYRLLDAQNNPIYDFEKIDSNTILNDTWSEKKIDPACNIVKK